MTAKTSNADGPWSTAGTWGPSGAPVAGDTVTIGATHEVYLTADAACKSIALSGELDLRLYDMQYDDASGAGINIMDATTAVLRATTATFDAPSEMRSASVVPANPWQLVMYDHVGYDVRNINMLHILLKGNIYALGNDVDSISFNHITGLSSTNPVLTHIGRTTRDPEYAEHFIPSRTRSRIHSRGSHAGSLAIEILSPVTMDIMEKLQAMVDTRKRFSFFSYRRHLPKCRIEAFSPAEEGTVYEKTSVRLVEDS